MNNIDNLNFDFNLGPINNNDSKYDYIYKLIESNITMPFLDYLYYIESYNIRIRHLEQLCEFLKYKRNKLINS